MNVPQNALVQAASAAVPLFSSPGLQAGVRGDIDLQAALAAFPLFGFSPCRTKVLKRPPGSPLKRAGKQIGGPREPRRKRLG